MVKVEVKGDEGELEYLERNLDSTKFDFYSEVVEYEDEEHEVFFLEKAKFDELDASEIKEEAESILRKFSALATLRSQIYYNFSVGRIIRSEDNSELKETSFHMDTVIKQGFEDNEKYLEWLELAEQDKRIEHMLNILSTGFDWYSLFKLFEMMQDDDNWVGKQEKYSEEKVELFESTAQSYDAIGLDARHANTKNKSGGPEYDVKGDKDPMKYEEAKSMIRTLCEEYFEYRAQNFEAK